jgi:hypothetical protein
MAVLFVALGSVTALGMTWLVHAGGDPAYAQAVPVSAIELALEPLSSPVVQVMVPA